jgi:hypothetical protein
MKQSRIIVKNGKKRQFYEGQSLVGFTPDKINRFFVLKINHL